MPVALQREDMVHILGDGYMSDSRAEASFPQKDDCKFDLSALAHVKAPEEEEEACARTPMRRGRRTLRIPAPGGHHAVPPRNADCELDAQERGLALRDA